MTQRRFPPPWSVEKLDACFNPNNRGVGRHTPAQQRAVPEFDCLWRPCTAHKRCHISPAVSRQRRERSHFPPRCLRLTQCQRQLPRLFPHVPPLIQLQHRPERLARCQRQRYQLLRHSPPGRGIGTLSLVERKPGSTDRLPGKIHKTCSHPAWLRTRERLDRYRRIPQMLDKKRPPTREREISSTLHTPNYAPSDKAIRSGQIRGEIRMRAVSAGMPKQAPSA